MTGDRHPILRIIDRREADGATGGHIFIANLSDIPGSVTLGPGLLLRRATRDEVQEIRSVVDWFAQGLERPRLYPWESRATRHPHPQGGGYRVEYHALEEGEDRYHLLSYEGETGMRHFDVGDASVLASGPEFVDGYHASWGRIASFGSARLLPFLERAGFDDEGFESFSSEDAADLVSVYSRVQSVAWGERIRSFISEHRQLYALGSHPRLRLLGRFAVLESLIVHKPDPKDPYDSITRQVKTKMKLLDRRFARPVKYDAFGISEPLDKVWTKLYSLRSAIAHGASPAFGKGSAFAFVHSLDNADRLVASAVRSVLRQVFEEPDLLADLRDC